MKILLLSLLRLGDVLMHREIVRALNSRYPQAQIHFLINAQFSSVQDLLPEVHRWKLFPRDQIQNILVEQKHPVQHAFRMFEESVDDLNRENYDLVLNLTHNFFSVRLMDLINAGQKRGACFQEGKKVSDQNRWQTYLNEKFSVNGRSRFHYIEVLLRSLDLPLPFPKPAQNKDDLGPVYLQILTADPKKNWGLSRFRQLLAQLQAANPHRQIRALCSPTERELALTVFEKDQIFSPSLQEAAGLLGQARLLITGDTSLQHLAAQVECQIVSIFLGSADCVKTAPWQSGAWVIRSQVSCAPCGHSEPCSRGSHQCAEDIEVDKVFSLAQSILKNEAPISLDKLVSQTRFSQGHLFMSPESFHQTLERAVWSCYLEKETASGDFVPAGIAGEMGSLVSQSQLDQISLEQNNIEKMGERIQIEIGKAYQSKIKAIDGKLFSEYLNRIREAVQEWERISPSRKDNVLQFQWALSNPTLSDFQILKDLRGAMAELNELTIIRSKILKELRGYHVRSKPYEEHSPQA